MKRLFYKLMFKLGFVPVKAFSISAVVTRKDGTVEDLGKIGEAQIDFTPDA